MRAFWWAKWVRASTRGGRRGEGAGVSDSETASGEPGRGRRKFRDKGGEREEGRRKYCPLPAAVVAAAAAAAAGIRCTPTKRPETS